MNSIAREQLESVIPRLNKIAELQDELRECVSPTDIKKASQKLWLLRQRQEVLEHRLEERCRQIQSLHLDKLTAFRERCQRFDDWADGLERRLGGGNKSKNGQMHFTAAPLVISDFAIPRVETDLENEFAVQAREVDWISATGLELAPKVNENEYDVTGRAEAVAERWKNLRSRWQQRLRRIEEAKVNSKKLSDDLRDLREWMRDTVETKLNRPVSLQDTSEREYKKKRTEYMELQKRLRKKTAKANEVFNTCDIFFNDSPMISTSTSPSSFDPLRTNYVNLKQRWDGLLTKSEDRKNELERLFKDWTAFNKDYERLQSWISEQSLILKGMDVQASRVSYESLSGIEADLDEVKTRQDNRLGDLDALNDVYCELAREYRLDNSDDLKSKFIQVNNDWEDLSTELEATLKRIRHSRQLYVNYRALREKEMTFLRQADARLTEIELSSVMEWTEKTERLSKLRREVSGRENLLDQVNEAGLHLVQRSEFKDAEHIEELSKEFSCLQADVLDRLERLLSSVKPPPEASSEEQSHDDAAADLPPISVNSSIQVDTLKFERDSSVQADTLLGTSAPDSGVSMATGWPTPEHQTRVTTPLSSSHSSAAAATAKILEEDELISDETSAEVASRLALSEDNYDQLLGDLERHLGEFHSNGDLLEEAVRNWDESEQDASQLLASCRSSLDLVSHYHDRIRTHPNRRKRIGSSSDSSETATSHSAAAVTAYDDRVHGAKERLKRLQELDAAAGKKRQLRTKGKDEGDDDDSVGVESRSERRESTPRRAVPGSRGSSSFDLSTTSTCPLCKSQNWRQLEQDLWRLETWLSHAKASLRAPQRSVPASMEQLEDAIQDHREFLMDLDSHKSLLLSINVVGAHLAEHVSDDAKARALQKRLNDVNEAWDGVCEDAAHWQTKLQTALLENSEFHRTIEELTDWLDSTTSSIRSSEPVDLSQSPSILESKRDKFVALHCDLQRCEPRIVSLQEAADQLELQMENRQCREVKRKLSMLSQKLRILINVCHVYSTRLSRALGKDVGEELEGALDSGRQLEEGGASGTVLPTLSNELLHLTSASTTTSSSSRSATPAAMDPHRMAAQAASAADISSSIGAAPAAVVAVATASAKSRPDVSEQAEMEEEVNVSVLARSYRFLGRVVRAAVPIQAMMLLLLGVSSIVPLDQDELICSVQNNLQRSFEPMLRWSNGPPPI